MFMHTRVAMATVYVVSLLNYMGGGRGERKREWEGQEEGEVEKGTFRSLLITWDCVLIGVLCVCTLFPTVFVV